MSIDREVLRPSSRLTVLLAEDEAELRDLLAQALRADGMRVMTVADGDGVSDELLEGEDSPDVLVTNVRMPLRSGIEVLRSLRRRGSNLPVILITAFGEAINRAEVATLGGAAVLEKPFDIDDLKTALKNLEEVFRRVDP